MQKMNTPRNFKCNFIWRIKVNDFFMYNQCWKLSFSVCECVLNHFSRVQLFVTPWTVACQAPLSLGFSRQEYWSGLPCLLQKIVPTQGSNLCLLCLLHWQVHFLPLALPGKPSLYTGAKSNLWDRVWGKEKKKRIALLLCKAKGVTVG